MSNAGHSKSVAIIGGGITGLAAAFRLQELTNVSIDLFEAANEIGGVLRTTCRQGYLLEHSADMFTTAEHDALDLCRRTQYDQELITPNPDNRRALLVHNGKLTATPRGFSLFMPTNINAVIESGLLSEKGKQDLLNEANIPPGDSRADESVADFARRRFGEEIYAKYIQPMVGGIYTGDPERLSMRATMAKFCKLEQQFGSLTAAGKQSATADQQASGARYSLFRTPRKGMQHWVQSLAAKLSQTKIHTSAQVEHIQTEAARWKLRINAEERSYDAVLLTAPAGASAQLLSAVAPVAAGALRGMESSSTAVVVLGHERSKFEHKLDAFGFVTPACENRKILAGSFASNKYPGRSPEGKVLIRVFVGGALQKELLEHSDPELVEIVRTELADLLGMSGESDFVEAIRWNDSMPQYNLGHLERIAKIENEIASLPGLELAGKSFSGVGLPACIRSAESAASRIAAAFQTSS